MATTRSRPSTRSKKTPPPAFSGDALNDDDLNGQPESLEGTGAEGREEQQAQAESPQITSSRLEQREIPSFSESREQRIAEAAYWRAEQRGFSPGYELDDWLQAEREIDARANAQHSAEDDGNDVPKTG